MDTVVRSVNQSANWDAAAQLKFVEACEQELAKGNREGAFFTSDGWKNVVQRFNQMTGRNYCRKQLRNHWDSMRRELSLYEDLMQGQTDIGWDPVKNTIVADKEWWNERMKVTKLFKKFKGKDMSLLKFKYAPLFSKIGATGVMVATPSQLSHHGREDSVNLDENVEDDLHPNESSGWCDEALPGNVSTPTIHDELVINAHSSGKRKTSSGSGLRKRKSALKVDPISTVNLEAEGKESPTPCAPSIRDCIQILYSMDGVEERTEFYGHAVNSFKDPDNREIFVSIPTAAGRLTWLKYNFQHIGGKL